MKNDTFAAKDKKQREGLNKWFKNRCKGTLEYCTGSGKSRCGALAVEYVHNLVKDRKSSILIIAPTEVIRDGWKAELKKWKLAKLISLITIECIQTVYKWTDMHFDLVVADEMHNYLSPQYIKFFQTNVIDRVLGLTAFIPDEYMRLLNDIAPIVDTLTTEEAEFLGLVTSYQVINYKLSLSVDEQFAYDFYSKKIDTHKETKGKDNWALIGKRKKLLYENNTKYDIIKQIIEIFGDSYGVIFTETIDSVDHIVGMIGDKAVAYHSKLKKPDKEIALKKLSDGRTKVRIIVAPKALNEGANLPRITWALIVANTGKKKEHIQRLGRIIRIGEDGKVAILVRLFASKTQEYDWIVSSQDSKVTYIETVEQLREIWQRHT